MKLGIIDHELCLFEYGLRKAAVATKTRAHSFGYILTKKPALSRAFYREKHEIARAAGIVKFWSVLQKRALVHLLLSKARAFNGPGYTPSFCKSAYFMMSQLAGGGGPLSALHTEILKIAAVHATA